MVQYIGRLRLGYHTEVPPKPDVFLNVGDEGVFHYEGTYFLFLFEN